MLVLHILKRKRFYTPILKLARFLHYGRCKQKKEGMLNGTGYFD